MPTPTHPTTITLLLTSALLLTPAFAQQPPTPAPTSTTDVRQLVDQGHHREALKLIAERLPTARGETPAGATERYELLFLRGECLLQTGQRAYAITAFEQASRSAPDRSAAATSRATAVLLRRSVNTAYRPARSTEQIDILAPESRARAMAALHADLAADVLPKVGRATDGNALPPMIDLLPQLLDTVAVEYAATGATGDAFAAATAMGKRARDLMHRELRNTRMRAEELLAYSQSSAGGYSVQTAGRPPQRFLSTAEADEIRKARDYVRRIARVAGQGREVARAQGGDLPAWDATVAEAAATQDRLDAILGD